MFVVFFWGIINMKGILWYIFLYGFFVEDFLFATWGIILRFEGSETHLPSFTALRLPGCQAGPWKGTMFTRKMHLAPILFQGHMFVFRGLTV